MLKPVSPASRPRVWDSSEDTAASPVTQNGEVPASLRTAYLKKVEGSYTFSRSVQLRRLLVYLGHCALEGINPPSEAEIATAVLHRDEQFDPQSDSAVRKEMSRLRAKLASYYRSEGSSDPVTIASIRPYRLEFRWRNSEGGKSADNRPCLLILPPPAGADTDALFDELMLCLAGSSRLRVISRTTAHWYSRQSSDVRQICSQSGAHLLVEMAFRPQDTAQALLLWIVDGPSGVSRASTRIAIPGAADACMELARRAASWLEQYEHYNQTR